MTFPTKVAMPFGLAMAITSRCGRPGAVVATNLAFTFRWFLLKLCRAPKVTWIGTIQVGCPKVYPPTESTFTWSVY